MMLRMQGMRRLRVGLLAAAFLGGPVILMAADSPAPAADSKAVPFTVLATGKIAGQHETGLSYARDLKSFEKVWSDLQSDGRLPKVDFKRRMVIVWVGGGPACDGYKLAHVREDVHEVSLEIEHSRQKPGHMCIALYSPTYLVAAVARTRKPIKFTLAEVPRS